jgi:hypothetical protein
MLSTVSSNFFVEDCRRVKAGEGNSSAQAHNRDKGR